MDVTEAINVMLYDSHMSKRAASLASGRASTFLSNTIARGGDVGSEVVASVAATCGYVLALIPSGLVPPGALTIDQAARRGAE